MPVCPVCATGSVRPMERFTPKKLDSYGRKGMLSNQFRGLSVSGNFMVVHFVVKERTSYQLIEKPHKKLFITWVSLSYASTIEVTTQLCRLGREVRYNLLNNINLSISFKLP